MLKNEVTFRIEDSAVQDFVGNGVKTVNGVWRIGEDDVKLFAAKRKKIKDIVAYDGEIVQLELRCLRTYEGCVRRSHLHRIDHTCTARCELKRD